MAQIGPTSLRSSSQAQTIVKSELFHSDRSQIATVVKRMYEVVLSAATLVLRDCVMDLLLTGCKSLPTDRLFIRWIRSEQAAGAGTERTEAQTANSWLIQQVLHTVCPALIPRPIIKSLPILQLFFIIRWLFLVSTPVKSAVYIHCCLTASQPLPRRQSWPNELFTSVRLQNTVFGRHFNTCLGTLCFSDNCTTWYGCALWDSNTWLHYRFVEQTQCIWHNLST